MIHPPDWKLRELDGWLSIHLFQVPVLDWFYPCNWDPECGEPQALMHPSDSYNPDYYYKGPIIPFREDPDEDGWIGWPPKERFGEFVAIVQPVPFYSSVPASMQDAINQFALRWPGRDLMVGKDHGQNIAVIGEWFGVDYHTYYRQDADTLALAVGQVIRRFMEAEGLD